MTSNVFMRSTALALLTGMLLSLGSAQAHGIWVAQRTGEWAVVLGEGALDDAYPPQNIKQVLGQTRKGTALPVSVRAQAHNVVFDAPSELASVAVSFEDGYWSQGIDGKWVAGSRSQVPGAKKVGYYQMFTRTVLASDSSVVKAFGLPLEILPLADPMQLKKGSKLRVQVLFEGKPLASKTIASDYLNAGEDHSIRTDAQGYAIITIRSSGLNVIKVAHSVRRIDISEADEDGYAATLAFALPQTGD